MNAEAKDKTPITLNEAIRAFGVQLKAQGRSPHTCSAYLRDLHAVAQVLSSESLPLSAITPAMLGEALADPALTRKPDGSPQADSTVHRRKAAVRSFFAWAEAAGHIADNPSRLITLHRLPPRTPAFLSEGEKRLLLKHLMDRASPLARRDRVLFELFLGTGLRLQEVADLDFDDVDLAAKHLRVRRAKGGAPQVKFLKTNLRILLRHHLNERRRQGLDACPALFLSERGARLCPRQIARRLEHWLREAGITKHLSPHGLRHTFATHLYGATSDLLVVQRALGHADVSTTQIYTHLIDGQLEEALERL